MSFQSSLDMLAFDFFSVNSRFYSLVSISLSIFSSALVLIWKCCVPTSLVSSCFTAIWLQCIPWLLLVPFTRPTVHYPSFVLIPLGPLFLLGIKSMGSSGFVQFGFQQMLLSSFTLSKILSRCPYCFNFDCIAATSLFLITSYYMYLESQGNCQNYFCCLLLSVH